MRYGYITTNIIDLLVEPKFNSERASQLLFAEPLGITDEQNGFYLIKQTDNYTGWVDMRMVQEIDEQAFNAYVNSQQTVVISSQAKVTNHKDTTIAPYFLYYSTLLRGIKVTGEVGSIQLPDGNKILLKTKAVERIGKKPRRIISGAMFISEAKRFLGVPYLWGGVSPAGFDCSGLVQSICRRFGLYVPRDTKDQIHIGTEISRDQIKTGDLLFFKRHVGFAIGCDRIIHSSMGGSGVRINSLQKGLLDYREDLDRDFNQARRIL